MANAVLDEDCDVKVENPGLEVSDPRRIRNRGELQCSSGGALTSAMTSAMMKERTPEAEHADV